ncbi:MAG: lauroyl acyltransferase, partial [Chitinophagaceae bacterium]
IYKPLANKMFDDWFMKMRCKFGNRMIAMRQTLRTLKETEHTPTVMAFGNDQSPRGKDVQYWTTFLNQPSSIQLGIEKIAVKTNRPVFYIKLKYIKRGYYALDCVPLCLNPSETKEFEITELHTRFLEQIIRDEPAYWLWSHRRWKHKPNVGENQNLDEGSCCD